MAGGLGRILVGGKDRGAGFALSARVVVTANHVVRGCKDKRVTYVPASGVAVDAERVQSDDGHDAAVLWLAGDAVEFLTVAAPVAGGRWQVASPPLDGNDPELHGVISTARMTIVNAGGNPVEVAQLTADEQLGSYEGYSGSAVLDPARSAVLALLVEQKPVRTAAAPSQLGARPEASNVLYAVPIGDIIAACGLPVRPARPLRFTVGLPPPAVLPRPGLLDKAVGRIAGTADGDAGPVLVLLRGAGGAGKTVLAYQLARDPRVWAAFPDGIIMVRAGQPATAETVTRQLQEYVGQLNTNLADALEGQRLLVIVDDVWDDGLLATLRTGLPGSVAVLATTRGVFVPGCAVIDVGAVSREQAIAILAGGTPRSAELDQVLGDLAETLFHWALLLNLAAAQLRLDDERDPGFGGEDEPPPAEPSGIMEQAKILRQDFLGDPTTLDDDPAVERDGAPARSVDLLIRRSLDWLRPDDQERFRQLSVFPPGAVLRQPVLEDLWGTGPSLTGKGIKLLARAGLVRRAGRNPLTIDLHDLVTAWLHHTCGRPGDTGHRPVHQRLAGLCQQPDGSLGELNRDRAEWLAYHLVHGGSWDALKALPTLGWRSAFLIATGSDGAFLNGLDFYGHAAVASGADPWFHAVRAWLFAAHVRSLIGALPVAVLTAMAVASPVAALTQACQHPEAGEAFGKILGAARDQADIRLLEQALDMARTIPSDSERNRAVAYIATYLAGIDYLAPALTDRAVSVAKTVSDWHRDAALVNIAWGLAKTDPADPDMIGRAVSVAEAISGRLPRDRALGSFAVALAAADPASSQFAERAATLARTLTGQQDRGSTLVSLARELAATDPARAAALIDEAIAVADPLSGEERDETLAGIASQLVAADPGDPQLIERSLMLARTISSQSQLSQTLARIARRLAVTDPHRADGLMDEAVALAESVSDERQRGETLREVALQLAGDPARTEQAVALAQRIPEEFSALGGIVTRIADSDPADPVLVQRAVEVAAAADDYFAWVSIANIAKRLAAANPRDESLVERAAGLAAAIRNDNVRGETLADLAGQLAAVDPPDRGLIDQALRAAGNIPGDMERWQAVTSVARRLAAVDPGRAAVLSDEATTLIDQAIAAAEAKTGESRSKALADIARRLAPVDPGRAASLINQVMNTTATVAGHDTRLVLVQASLAERIAAADPQDPDLTDRALAVVETIPGDAERSKAIRAIAQRLAAAEPRDPAVVSRALAVAGNIADSTKRSSAVGAVAERLAAADPADPALISRARAIAETITGSQARSDALERIDLGVKYYSDPVSAPVMAKLKRLKRPYYRPTPRQVGPEETERAVTAANAIEDEQSRAHALADIAIDLATADPWDPEQIERGVTVARSIPHSGLGSHIRSRAFGTIARRIAAADPRDQVLTERALSVAEFAEYWDQSEELATIAEELATTDPRDQDLIARAETVAGAIREETRRAEVSARIAVMARGKVLEEVARWRQLPLIASLDLLGVYLRYFPDRAAADGVGRAVVAILQELTQPPRTVS